MTQAVFASQGQSIQRVLPCFPGYAMGGIILTSELELPYLEQEKCDITEEIQRINLQKKKLTHNSEPSTTASTVSDSNLAATAQKTMFMLNRQIQQLEASFKSIEEKIKKFEVEKSGHFSFETMLPIDYSRSELDYRYRADESENMHFIIIKKHSVADQIDSFADHLTKMRYLPTVIDLINQISQTILKQSQQENQEVCLLGSFVTLSHVRVMDPIVLRQDAILSDQLRDPAKAARYSVISESVLGGVFIGFGTRILKNQDSSSDDAKSVASHLHVFSYVSQGAIPPTDNFNLWDTYNGWKKRLTTDVHCGFPIAFKVRKLTDVLQENGLNNSG